MQKTSEKPLNKFDEYKQMENGPEKTYLFGRCCELGIGVAKNPARAIKYYQRAADFGFRPANFALSNLYLSNKSLKDDSLAIFYTCYAFELGYQDREKYLFGKSCGLFKRRMSVDTKAHNTPLDANQIKLVISALGHPADMPRKRIGKKNSTLIYDLVSVSMENLEIQDLLEINQILGAVLNRAGIDHLSNKSFRMIDEAIAKKIEKEFLNWKDFSKEVDEPTEIPIKANNGAAAGVFNGIVPDGMPGIVRIPPPLNSRIKEIQEDSSRTNRSGGGSGHRELELVNKRHSSVNDDGVGVGLDLGKAATSKKPHRVSDVIGPYEGTPRSSTSRPRLESDQALRPPEAPSHQQ